LHADLNETYPVGKVDEDSKKLMRVTRQALDAAIRICKPGALIRDIGKEMCVICLVDGCFPDCDYQVNRSPEPTGALL